MEEIINNWCKTNQLSAADAMAVISEYFHLLGKETTATDLQGILTLHLQMGLPIDWDKIFVKIAESLNGTITLVQSVPDQAGRRKIIARYFHKQTI